MTRKSQLIQKLHKRGIEIEKDTCTFTAKQLQAMLDVLSKNDKVEKGEVKKWVQKMLTINSCCTVEMLYKMLSKYSKHKLYYKAESEDDVVDYLMSSCNLDLTIFRQWTQEMYDEKFEEMEQEDNETDARNESIFEGLWNWITDEHDESDEWITYRERWSKMEKKPDWDQHLKDYKINLESSVYNFE